MTRMFSAVVRRPARLAVVVLIAVLASPLAAPAQDTAGPAQSFSDGQAFEVRYTATFSADDLDFDKLRGYDLLRLADGTWLDEPGRPMLPARMVRIALPAGMAVTTVRAAATQTVELPGEYLLYPCQPPRRISVPVPDGSFVAPDPGVYASPALYPQSLVKFGYQNDLAGQGIAVLRVCPFQYSPSQKRLTFCSAVDIVLEGVAGYECGDYLPAGISERGREAYEAMIAGLVVNPAQAVLRVSDQPRPATRGVPPGAYEYVIITQDGWVDDFQPIVNWKTRKGVPATIVTTSWIYNSGGYSGSNPEKIRAFVQDAHDNWGTVYFLIGGDTNVVPYQTRVMLGDDIPNDTYYGDFDDDWACEVHVGRAAARTASDISVFNSKVLTYEQDPPLTDYAATAALFGFDLNEYGSGEGEGCKEYIRTVPLPDDWTCRTEYDSEPGSHIADVINYMNQGNNLINHIDHSSTDVMGAGGTNHGDYLDNYDMSALYNGDRQSILYSIGCWACNYASNTCIAEAFVRNSSGGGVAFMGNSRYGWYQPYQTDGVSLRYDRFLFIAIFNRGFYRLGEAFSDHKNTSCQPNDYYQYIYLELTLLGDPEMPIWTADPRDLSVEHDASLVAGVQSAFPVQVTAGGGMEPVPDAVVCLWKDGEVYEVAHTDGTGVANFSFVPASPGTMLVTVTARDFLPYQGEAQVQQATTYTLTIDVSGPGSVMLDPPGGTYTPGTWVELTAEPDPGASFEHWEGALTGSDNPETLLVTDDMSVTAVFADFEDCNDNGVPDDEDIATGTSSDFNSNGIPDECDGLGDLNCDGECNAYDIDGFICALSPECDYEGVYGCDRTRADTNGDGDTNAYDIDYFIQLVGSG